MFILGFGTPRESFTPGEAWIPVEGIVIDGNMLTGFRWLTGEMLLEEAGLKTGAPVKGKMRVNIWRLDNT